MSLNDDLRVGPILDLHQNEGRQLRQNWLQNLEFDFQKLSTQVENDYLKIQKIKTDLSGGKKVYVWSGRTVFEQLAAARLLRELNKATDLLKILIIPPDLSLTTKAGGKFKPETPVVLAPEQMHVLLEYFITLNEKENKNWVRQWETLAGQTGNLRTRKNKAIEQVEEDFFDKNLLRFCSQEYIGAARVVGHTLIDLDFNASDATLNWRLHKLVRSGQLVHQGSLRELRDYRVKLPNAKSNDASKP
ncbi:DUF3658 domain-containing protein [Catalinimonas sp. 4WD22]|uniref:DUF3658 domain-containing protein n=1 Tax=Catalinimonas locisalis TaxID=3133978 RepID=UPI00310168A6